MEHAGSALVYASYTAVVGVGVFGMLEEPAPSVVRVMGEQVGSTIWSALFLLFGVAAIILRLANRVGWRWPQLEHATPGRRRRLRWPRYRLDTSRSEAVCLIVLGVVMLSYAAVVGWWGVLQGTPGAGQTALALVVLALFLPGVALLSLAIIRRELLAAHDYRQDILRRVHHEIRRQETS